MSQVFEDYNTKKCVIIIILSWILISCVAAFWGYTHGASMYMLLALIIPTWMLIKIRLDESKNQVNN
jgi:hypothetical protein